VIVGNDMNDLNWFLFFVLVFAYFVVNICTISEWNQTLFSIFDTNNPIDDWRFWQRGNPTFRRTAIQKLQWNRLLRGYGRQYIREPSFLTKEPAEIGRIFRVRIVDSLGENHVPHFLEVRCGTGRTVYIPIDINEVNGEVQRSTTLVSHARAAQAWTKGISVKDWNPPIIRT
jgi:hypothetical protein